MSRSRHEPGPPSDSVRSGDASSTDADSRTDTGLPTDAESRTPRTLGRALILSILLAVVWYGVMVATILTTANPVVVNRVQIESSVLVVAGTVSESGEVHVEQLFRGVLPDKPVQVVLPADVPPGHYILPLSRLAERFEITPSKTSSDLRRIYPVTDDVVQQLQSLLDE